MMKKYSLKSKIKTLSISLAMALSLTFTQAPEARAFQAPPEFDASGFMFLGGQQTQFTNLNSSLSGAGYSQLSPWNMSFGGGAHIVFHGFLFEFTGEGFLSTNIFNINPTSAKQVWVDAGTFLFNIGYAVYPVKNLKIYPIIGLGAGDLTLRFFENKTNLPPTFKQILDSPGRFSSISNTIFLLNAGLGIDYRIPIFDEEDFGFIIGLRGGYLFSPIPSNFWLLNNAFGATANSSSSTNNGQFPIAGGPGTSITGPYLKLTLGF